MYIYFCLSVVAMPKFLVTAASKEGEDRKGEGAAPFSFGDALGRKKREGGDTLNCSKYTIVCQVLQCNREGRKKR